MRLIIHEAIEEFSHIIDMACKDPTSWEGWACMHISINTGDSDSCVMPNTLSVAETLNEMLARGDGTIYHCDAKHIFVICRGYSAVQLRMILQNYQELLFEQLHISSNYQVFDLQHECHAIRLRCREYDIWPEDKVIDYPHSSTLFPTISGFEDILSSNKRERPLRTKAKILLVEDDPIARRLVSKLFKEDYWLITAENAEDAVMQYILHAPDIVFLDIGLPDHDGFTVIQSILERDPEAYIVMFSGNSHANTICRSMNQGAKGFVQKPFRKERMEHYLEMCRKN